MLTLPCKTERNTHVSYSNGAMEECLRRFESPVASHTAKQDKRKSATKHGDSSGAMEEYLRRFESPAAHRKSAVGMDLAASDRHGAARDIDATTLPNWATNLVSILGTSNGAMDCYVTARVQNCARRTPYPA